MQQFKHCAILIALLTCTATWTFSQKQSPSDKTQKEYHGSEANQKIAGAIYFKEGKNSSFPSFVRFAESKQVKHSEFFAWLKKTLNHNADIGFKLKAEQPDKKTGITHYRYVQTFKGVPVAQSWYIVHVKDGAVKYFNGTVFAVPSSLSASPALPESAALESAKKIVGAERYKWEDPYWEGRIKERTKDPAATYLPKGELCWNVKDYNTAGKSPSFSLAYRFDIAAASPEKEIRVFIDANTGALVQTLPMESNCNVASCNTIWDGNQSIRTSEAGGTFWLTDDCQAAVINVRDWNSTDCTDAAALISNGTNTWNNNNNEIFGGSVLWATKESYNYWNDVMLRNSYDNGGGDVDGYINAVFTDCFPDCFASCRYTDNASMSFSTGRMKVGLGSSMTLANSWGSLDIIGHEFAHAVTGSGTAAQLEYQDESGALNESFSDIFGEMVEKNTNGSNDWLMGDDRTDGYIRNMSDPQDKNDPDTYMGDDWAPLGGGDNGGVHTNSGVQNFWFYLLSNGGSGTNDNGDAYSVSGVGTAVAAWIAQYNLLNELGTTSTYSDARAGAIAAAIDGYGACSNVVKQVTNAWYAVGVGGQFIELSLTESDYNGSDISCNEACDGSVTANVSGGFSPIYEWSPGGATTSSISGLCSGLYTVTVTDLLGLGCSLSANTFINDPPALSVTISSTLHNGYHISCNGGSDGVAIANPVGGTGARTYDWSSGQTSKSIGGLTAGSYTVTVTDANGCEAIESITLTEPPLLTTTVDATSDFNGYDVQCFGGSNGVAEAYPAGGVGGYEYLWSDGAAQTTKIATGLSAILYTVTVTDDNSCTVSESLTLTEPPQLTIDAGPNKIVYYGYADSACATLTRTGAGGGVPPYVFTWSTGSHAVSINVCPQFTTTYYVTIKDANLCEMTDSVKVCAIDVRCGPGLKNIKLCHKAGGDTGTINICIDKKGAKAHFTHHPGIDQLAACGTLKVCSFTGPSAKADETSDYVEQVLLEGSTYLAAFPNPFTDLTTIRFIFPQDNFALLKVYDISGKVVADLFEGTAVAGNVYEVNFDGSRYSNGIYFLHLNNKEGGLIKKLVLAR